MLTHLHGEQEPALEAASPCTTPWENAGTPATVSPACSPGACVVGLHVSDLPPVLNLVETTKSLHKWWENRRVFCCVQPGSSLKGPLKHTGVYRTVPLGASNFMTPILQ